jgi:Cu(I)/Ag(I) efflux system membrane protein CusA/SilA
VRAIAARLPGTRSAAADTPGGETILRFAPDAEALARHQVDQALVEDTAALILGGGQIPGGQIVRDGRRIPVRLLPDRTPRPLEELLRQATVRARPAAGGAPIALALVGRPQLATVPAMLRTEGGRAVSYVYVDLEEGTDLLGYVERGQRALAAAMASGELALGPGEALEWTGQYELMAAGRRRLLVIAPLVLLSMLGLLFLQFRSLTEALIVLGTVPLALVGSVWTLFLLGYPLSAPVWVGLISVVGLAMQTGVVMVVYIDQAFWKRVRAGTLQSRADIVAAHAEGTVRRLRPKLMTVTAMAGALLPLLWSEGAGAEIGKRVAAPMVGGLAFSAFVTLEVIPVLYTLWRHHQLRRAQRSGVPLAQVLGTMPRWAEASDPQ